MFLILAIFPDANFLKVKIIKLKHIKGIGSPLLISVDLGILTKKRKKGKTIRLEPRLVNCE